MLELICSIPDEIGWVIVGATGMFTLGFFLQALFIPMVVRPIIEAVHEWKEKRAEKMKA